MELPTAAVGACPLSGPWLAVTLVVPPQDRDLGAPGPRLPPRFGPRSLPRLSEPKRGKNRVHLDLLADDRDVEEARLVALGAMVVARRDESDESWTVMRDPYGNEFCLN